MSNKAEKTAIKTYPFVTTDDCCGNAFVANATNDDIINLRSGFIKGYEQAEKELELTWEDIKEIQRLLDVVWSEQDVIAPIDEDTIYEEVLRRFKEIKKWVGIG